MIIEIKRNCCFTLILNYNLNKSIDREIFSYFPKDSVQVNAFSEIVSCAKDQFTINRVAYFYASGILGENTIQFSFEKLAPTLSELTFEVMDTLLNYESDGSINQELIEGIQLYH